VRVRACSWGRVLHCGWHAAIAARSPGSRAGATAHTHTTRRPQYGCARRIRTRWRGLAKQAGTSKGRVGPTRSAASCCLFSHPARHTDDGQQDDKQQQQRACWSPSSLLRATSPCWPPAFLVVLSVLSRYSTDLAAQGTPYLQGTGCKVVQHSTAQCTARDGTRASQREGPPWGGSAPASAMRLARAKRCYTATASCFEMRGDCCCETGSIRLLRSLTRTARPACWPRISHDCRGTWALVPQDRLCSPA